MNIRYSHHYDDAKHYDTATMRRHFLVGHMFEPGKTHMTYSHYDRIIFAGITPSDQPLGLEAGKELACEYFLERREMGVINIGGGDGYIVVDGERFDMKNQDGLYVGQGCKDIQFVSLDAANPAKFYMNSGTAHVKHPTVHIPIEKANKVHLGTDEECNKRTINQYVHPSVCKSCQLVMGMTILAPGSIWNTMPSHTHDRRMEVYLYFNMDEDNVVFHMMGEPQETRHIVVRNEEAVISPSWSIHSGVGTKNYTFIWGMVGENQTFTDMDNIKTSDLR